MKTSGKQGFGVLALVLAGASCGGEADVTVLDARVRFDAQVVSQVDRVSIYVLGPKMADGKFLPCSLLRLRTVDPTSADVDLLASRTDINLGSSSGTATLGDIPSGDGRLVYVEAYGGTNVIGNGCEEQVKVESGKTRSVTINVYLFP